MPPAFLLARWQLRRNWKLLSVVTLGILAAIIFVCSAPLYLYIASTAGLRSTLTTSINNTSIVTTGKTTRPTSSSISHATKELNTSIATYANQYINAQASQFFAETDTLELYDKANKPEGLLTILGTNVQTAKQYVQIQSGRLPSSTLPAKDAPLEIAITVTASQQLKASVNTILVTKIRTMRSYKKVQEFTLPLKVVGIIAPSTKLQHPGYQQLFSDTGTSPLASSTSNITTFLTSDAALLSLLTSYIPAKYHPGQPPSSVSDALIKLETPLKVSWYHSIDATKITSNDLQSLLTQLNTLIAKSGSNSNFQYQFALDDFTVLAPIEMLEQYRNQIQLSQLPTSGLVLVIFALLLYFVALMMDLLIERQSSSIALIRSRGASRSQIFMALLLQGCILSTIALILGPILAFPTAQLLGTLLLPTELQTTTAIIWQDPSTMLQTVLSYALVTVVVIILTLVLAINTTTSLDVLALRRASARSSGNSLWQRFHMDIVAIVIVLIGYAVSMYLTDSRVLTPQLRLLLLSPLVLARTSFTIIALILVFLRLFPRILNLASQLSTWRSKGASSMVALSQLARTPHKSMRMTLLLSLATAFMMFALVFYASQEQRAVDVAATTIGADIQGTFAKAQDITALADKTARFKTISGVQAASVGTSIQLQIANNQQSVTIVALDTNTYGNVLNQTEKAQTQTFFNQLHTLSTQRDSFTAKQRVPVLVHAQLWDELQLQPNMEIVTFHSNYSSKPIYLVAVGKIPYVPTTHTYKGMLVDLQTFNAVFSKTISTQSQPVQLTFDTLWLKTTTEPNALNTLRTQLIQGNYQLAGIQDRRDLIQHQQHDPLFLQIIGILVLGPLFALVLVLVGNLISSWLTTRDRLTHFVLLRALGATPRHIASTLTWEQAIIYVTSILLGIFFGSFLSWMVVPTLLFTSAPTQQINTEEIYLAQNSPPIQVIMPALLLLAFALLVAICFIAIGVMVRIVSKPSIATTLRLNED